MENWDERTVTHRFADLGDVRLHYVEAGSGPLIVLLHGFPEFWYSWRSQIPALAAAGYRVVAPDMRGYNLSDKPRGVTSYAPEVLARDVARLIEACGATRAVVAGHDWGGAVAWIFAMRYPAMLDQLVILNAPHPARMAQALRTLRQLARSWYIFYFQLPWLPEAGIRAAGFAALRRVFRTDPLRPGAFTDEDIHRYVEAMAQPGALTATINYYRAAVRQRPDRMMAELKRVDAPVLVIWGERDRYLGPELASPDRRWVPNARVVRLSDASHWVQHDRPERVNELLLEFVRPRAASSVPTPEVGNGHDG
jgi:pimeloyl-ACP methyl ester carboxylesterase